MADNLKPCPFCGAPAPAPHAGVDIETQAWNCDEWPDWLHDVVNRTNEVADRLDMSAEQAHAYAVLYTLENRT